MSTAILPSSVSNDLRSTVFLEMFPTLCKAIQRGFRRLHGERREEAIQEAVANAFVAFSRLVDLGRMHFAFPSVLARFAVAQVRDGRRVGGVLNVRDVSSEYAQQRKQHSLQRLDLFNRHAAQWCEVIVEDYQTPIPDQVCFRIDFPEWLSRLRSRDRRVAEALADGDSTGEIARRFGISAARVSQLRRELHASWEKFHAEEHGAAAKMKSRRPIG